MKYIIILTLIFGCGPEIEVNPLNDKPICLYGIRKTGVEREFIECNSTFNPDNYSEWKNVSFKKVNSCEECN